MNVLKMKDFLQNRLFIKKISFFHYNLCIMSLISIKNCRVQDINGVYVNNLSWTMNAGEAWLVVGPNGGGKAEFLRGLAGEKQVIADKDGEYFSEFENSVEIVSLERAARLIEEERELDESEYMDRIDIGRTGRRFICEVLGGPDSKHKFDPLPPVAERLETLPEVKLCGIEKILDRGIQFMSTGEIRRTLLCRALLSKKKLLILSDPFSGLDVTSRGILLEFFQKMAGKKYDGSTPAIILGMERYKEIPETITNVIEFEKGQAVFIGTKSEYEKILAEREAEKSKTRDAEKNAFVSELKNVQSESAILNEDFSSSRKDVTSSTEAVVTSTGKDVTSSVVERSLIAMNDVNVGWDDHKVLRNFTWSVIPGEHWFIRGPNGSGKTTLLELITGDNKQVYCNDVWLFGRKRGTGESIWDIKKKMGIVSYRLHVEYRMVGSTDLEGVIISGFRDTIGLYEQRTDIEVQTARRWLKLAGFEGREMESFSSLSYGEQRAILIIRAAVKNPDILILDEPCHGLDDQYRQKILDLLETVGETGTTSLLHVTHDPTEVLPCEKNILELIPDSDPMYKIIRK